MSQYVPFWRRDPPRKRKKKGDFKKRYDLSDPEVLPVAMYDLRDQHLMQRYWETSVFYGIDEASDVIGADNMNFRNRMMPAVRACRHVVPDPWQMHGATLTMSGPVLDRVMACARHTMTPTIAQYQTYGVSTPGWSDDEYNDMYSAIKTGIEEIDDLVLLREARYPAYPRKSRDHLRATLSLMALLRPFVHEIGRVQDKNEVPGMTRSVLAAVPRDGLATGRPGGDNNMLVQFLRYRGWPHNEYKDPRAKHTMLRFNYDDTRGVGIPVVIKYASPDEFVRLKRTLPAFRRNWN